MPHDDDKHRISPDEWADRYTERLREWGLDIPDRATVVERVRESMESHAAAERDMGRAGWGGFEPDELAAGARILTEPEPARSYNVAGGFETLREAVEYARNDSGIPPECWEFWENPDGEWEFDAGEYAEHD